MKSASFNKLIADALTTPETSVISYARRLKEAGLMTTGARGRNAPEMTPLDAARVTLAILTTDSPLHCVERVLRFGQVKYSPNYRSRYSWHETLEPLRFAALFKGQTLEEVLASLFGLPASMGITESALWFDRNVWHLRVTDFDVLAELFQWKRDGAEVKGEIIVPFKGDPYDADFARIKGGVRTERSISGLSFLNIGIGLLSTDQDQGAN